MIFGDVIKELVAVFFTPGLMRHGFEGSFEVAVDVVFIERIVDLGVLIVLLLVEVVAKCKVETRLADMIFVVRDADDCPVGNSRLDFGITVHTHD